MEEKKMDISFDISNTVLTTDRLILRAWQEGDLNDFFEYASVEGVGEMAGWRHHGSIEESRKILNSFIAEKSSFAIVDKESNRVIGSLGLHKSWANNDERYKHLKVKEIGYVLSKAFWGKGIMPEAVKAVIEFCKNEYGIEAFTCGHFSKNQQSRRVIEKCGFTFVEQNVFYARQLQESFEDMRYILILGDAN